MCIRVNLRDVLKVVADVSKTCPHPLTPSPILGEGEPENLLPSPKMEEGLGVRAKLIQSEAFKLS